MWIVRLALRRPYTFAVFALLLMILGPLSVLNTPTDIFPNIDIPVVSVMWNYSGLSPQEMANRITTPTERSMTTTVNDIEHIESQTLTGLAIIKVYFQPHANIASAVAQLTAIMQTAQRSLPPGTQPPLILQYNASSVPILQLGLSGEGLTEQQLNDYGLNVIRLQLATVEGAAIPYPYGGKQRQVQVDLNTEAMQAKGITPDIEVLQDLPDDLKAKTDTSTKGEASLRGHLKGDAGTEQTGSQSYIPPDAKDDKALNMAQDLLRGVQVNSAFPPNVKTPVPN